MQECREESDVAATGNQRGAWTAEERRRD